MESKAGRKKLVLIGGGGHCKSVLDAAVSMGVYSDIVITDPVLEPGTRILNHKVVGPDYHLPELFQNGFHYAFITVGSLEDNVLRKKLYKTAKEIGFSFPVIIDSTASVSEHAMIEKGTFIGKRTVVNANARIGNQCIINTGAVIEHDCCVGDFTHISVGALLCGSASVGNDSFVGAGSVIIQEVSVGSQTVIGANSTVLKDIGDHKRAYGVVNGIS